MINLTRACELAHGLGFPRLGYGALSEEGPLQTGRML